MSLPEWREEPIAKKHARASFDCGEPALNEFLRRYARQSHDRGAAKTFLAISKSDGKTILGFYSLCPASFEYARVPEIVRKGLARHGNQKGQSYYWSKNEQFGNVSRFNSDHLTASPLIQSWHARTGHAPKSERFGKPEEPPGHCIDHNPPDFIRGLVLEEYLGGADPAHRRRTRLLRLAARFLEQAFGTTASGNHLCQRNDFDSVRST